jgi:integrase
MRRSRVSYLESRPAGFYFRFQIPSQFRLIAGSSCVRVCLRTRDRAIARERIATVLPHVYSLKRLCREGRKMTSEEHRRALSFAVKRIVETLETWDEPWRDDRQRIPQFLEWKLLKQSFAEWPDLHPGFDMTLDINARRYAAGEGLLAPSPELTNESLGATLARIVLNSLGIAAVEDSDAFAKLSADLEKLQLGVLRVMEGRTSGDPESEEGFKSYYRRLGYLPSQRASAAASTPTIGDAWKEYSAEKLGGPKPAWADKNVRTQEATFGEFREIIGNVHVGEVTRDAMLTYRNAIARLPSNRQKRYPGKSIAELLTMDIPASQLPSPRTIGEKLIRIGAFLKWCRDIKGYLTTDPLRGVHVAHESRSYAPFNQEDLRRLFNSPDYQRGEHSKSWRYWIPLIALYTGARQTEIAQLRVRDVVQEDGTWIFVIADDPSDGQKVKTSAGVRKVPVSSKLKELGFLDYVACLKARGKTRLFPDLKRGRDGWGHYVSRWFAEDYKPRVGIEPDPTGRRKVFHSFRHTAITKALSSGQPLAHVQQVFGHEQSLLGESATYMHAFPVAHLLPVIESLDYGLNHSACKDAWKQYAANWLTPTESARASTRVKRAA